MSIDPDLTVFVVGTGAGKDLQHRVCTMCLDSQSRRSATGAAALIGVVRLTAVALGALVTACATAPAAPSRTVTIERTTFGIAHITASDWEGIAYGTAYAHAKDNVCQDRKSTRLNSDH